MKTGLDLSMGEKIKLIRHAKDVTQQQLVENLSITRSRLSQIENDEDYGHDDVSSDTLMQIRKALNLEALPLTEAQREGFKADLAKWSDVITANKFEEAKEMRKKLSAITFAPFDEELNTFFNLIDCKLVLSLRDIPTAETILDTVANKYLGDLPPEFLGYYYRNKSMVCALHHQHQDALVFMTKAFKLMSNVKQDAVDYYGMGVRNYNVGYIRRSIMFLEEALKLCANEPGSVWERYIKYDLVRSYIGLKDLDDAAELLDKMHKEAKDSGDNKFLCDVLIFYGYMRRVSGYTPSAHGYLNEAMEYVDKESKQYLEVLYQKARCYIADGGITVCEELLEEGKRLSKDNKHATIMFDSLKHLTTLKKDESIEYLETVTLPHLLNEVQDYPVALEYSKLLQKYYEQKSTGTIKKALETEKMITHIYERMFMKGEPK